MKFGALLRTSAGEVPELLELFVAYKQLKKHLKRLPEKGALAGGTAAITEAQARALGATEADFVAALSADVARFNDLFLEREEDAVIRLRSLEDDGAAASAAPDLKDVYRRFVDFHGEMLLLVHWSILAYTGLVKILKKHHKRTGLLVRAPHLDNLAGQPFCSTELMSELVRKAEADIDALRGRLSAAGTAPRTEPSAASHSAAILQAARIRSGADGGPACAAAELLALASDSGSAPSGDEGSSEESDAETAHAAESGGLAAGAGAAAAAAPGLTSTGKRKRRGEEAGSGSGAAAGAVGAAASPAATRRRGDGDAAVPAATAAADGAAAAPASRAAAAAAPASSGSASGTAASGRAGVSVPSARPQQQLRQGAQPEAAGSEASGSRSQQGATAPVQAAAASGAGLSATPPPQQPQQQVQQQPRPPRILAQTQAALGLWKELTETASTPSTVLPVRRPPAPRPQHAASSVTTDQSAA